MSSTLYLPTTSPTRRQEIKNSTAFLRTRQEDGTQKLGDWRNGLIIHPRERTKRQKAPSSDPPGRDGTEETKADLSLV